MTVQQGMDSARVREIAGQLRTGSRRISDVQGKGTASARVLRGSWEGEDATTLLDSWEDDAVTRLAQAAERLMTAAEDLGRQADQQDQASDATGGGHSQGSGVPTAPPGPGAPGGPFGGGRQKPLEGSVELPKTDVEMGEYSVTGRGQDAPGVRTNTDEDGNKHHYDPLTGKTWVEDKDGRWTDSTDTTGHWRGTDTETTEYTDGSETKRESSYGEGGGRREWGESYSDEKDFDNKVGDRISDVNDAVRTEPFYEKKGEVEADAAVAKGAVGNDQTGASGSVLSADASAEGAYGASLDKGLYAEGGAQAGAYVGKGEAHWGNNYGTAAEVEGYVGAQASVEGSASIGPDGAQVAAGGEVFAGGKVEGAVSQDVGDYGTVGVGGSVSYGIGAEANVEGEISMDKVGFSGDIGLTLGVGAEVNVDLSFSPKEIADDLTFWD